MGPGDGIQIQRLMDLPTTLETADSVSNPNISSPLQATQQPPGATVPTRVKSMFQQSSPGGKLPSRLPSHHPQRSISHNEVSWRVLLSWILQFFLFCQKTLILKQSTFLIMISRTVTKYTFYCHFEQDTVSQIQSVPFKTNLGKFTVLILASPNLCQFFKISPEWKFCNLKFGRDCLDLSNCTTFASLNFHPQCGNLAIFLLLWFFMKSILADFRRSKTAVLTIFDAFWKKNFTLENVPMTRIDFT